MTSRRGLSIVGSALALVLVVSATAGAQVGLNFDHLKCYKLRDFAKKATYSVNLIPEQNPPFSIEQGCKVKVPAKLFCINVFKTAPQPVPPPPGAPPGLPAQDYLCYAVKCPKTPLPQLVVTDQFGRRDVLIKPPKYLCAPAQKDPQHQTPVPTRTPTPTPPPLPTETPTATRTPDGCDFDTTGAKRCAGDCPPDATGQAQQCVFLINSDGTSDCDCRPPNPACHLPMPGGNQCIGPCPDPRDKCRNGVAGEPPCVCSHPCSPDPSDPTVPPTCSGDCPNPTDICVASTAGGCDCRPSTTVPCGNAMAPQCDGHCPQGEMCHPGGPSGCFCETGNPPLCGQGIGPPQCLGVCPPNTACVVTGPAPGSCICQ